MSNDDSTIDPDLEAALEACATEPVHTPGAIQPHGVLISCDAGLERVRQVSVNIERWLGVSVQRALAGTPEDLLGRQWVDEARQIIEGASRFHVVPASLRVQGQARRFRMLPYRSGSRAVVELEPIEGEPERWLFSALAEWQTQLERFDERDALLTALSELVRDLAGYDRIMVYRFDEDWNGSVIVESRSPDADSYLGHHFPASDIPEQVRRLYKTKPVRDIPDATAEAVALAPAEDPEDDAPLDLSRGILRAAAPIHRVYLANMGVVASMSIAMSVGGRLWGLLACHGEQANVLPPALRDALRTMVQSAAFQLELIETREQSLLLERANNSRDLLVDERGEFPRPELLLERYGEEWLEIFAVSGVIVFVDERQASVGKVPESTVIEKVTDWLDAQSRSEPVWSSREVGGTALGQVLPARFAGLLAVRLPVRQPQSAWLLLFRSEKVETRIWAGNPEKTLEKRGGRLSPRSSFKAWREEVRGCSNPWTASEIRAAVNLGTDLAALVAASEIKRLNERLTGLATHDHLTGLWNRYRMEGAIDHEIAMAGRYGRRCSVLMFDIDYFKRFNDSFGHEAGDEALIRVAESVRAVLRETDRVGRWGGEEFIVLAPDTGGDGAGCLAERVRRAVEEIDLGERGHVTVSIGLAVVAEGEGRRELIARADSALYAAKEGGRNRVAAA